MYRLIPLLFLVGCSSLDKKDVVIPEDVPSVIEETAIVEANINQAILQSLELPPLDLYFYRDVKYNVVYYKGEKVLTLTYEDFVKVLDLLKLLENRIEIRESQIDDINNILIRSDIQR